MLAQTLLDYCVVMYAVLWSQSSLSGRLVSSQFFATLSTSNSFSINARLPCLTKLTVTLNSCHKTEIQCLTSEFLWLVILNFIIVIDIVRGLNVNVTLTNGMIVIVC